MMPLVTIGVPVYNVEPYIERCASSLLEQTYSNIEIIFVNDCSTDNSYDILSSFIAKNDNKAMSRIVVMPHNSGLSSVRNKILEEAKGEFIMWVDSDDWIETDMVEKLVSAQLSADADIVTCNTIVHKKNNVNSIMKTPPTNDARDFTRELLKKQIPVSVWARLIRLSLYKDNGIKAIDGINIAEDYQVMPRVAWYAKKVCTIAEPLYHYNCTNQVSYTANYSPEKADMVLTSMELLESFFNNKGNEYRDALLYAKADFIAHDLVKCCRHNLKDRYYKFKNEFHCLPRRSQQSIRLPFKLFLLIPSFSFAKVYVKLIDFII